MISYPLSPLPVCGSRRVHRLKAASLARSRRAWDDGDTFASALLHWPILVPWYCSIEQHLPLSELIRYLKNLAEETLVDDHLQRLYTPLSPFAVSTSH